MTKSQTLKGYRPMTIKALEKKASKLQSPGLKNAILEASHTTLWMIFQILDPNDNNESDDKQLERMVDIIRTYKNFF